MPFFKRLLFLAAIAAFFSTALGANPADETPLNNSVKGLSRHVRQVAPLRPEHLGREQEFQVALQIREFPKMLARIATGERISAEEMDERYLPLPADYEAVIDWAKSQHLTITQTDPLRLAVFLKGTIGQIQQALRTQFAQVTVEEGTFISAVTPPSIPARLAKAVLGVNGLQPEIHPHHMSTVQPETADKPPYLVKEIEQAYGAANLGYTGAGQTIAILIDTFPAKSDLTAFWSHNNIPQTLSNIQEVQAVPGTLSSPMGEETLDAEWTSGIASGAAIRIYATHDLNFSSLDKGLQRILTDLPNQPTLHQLSISLGLGETDVSNSQLQTDAQYFAELANAGVSVFVSSGDDGSEPQQDGVIQPSYFSSDPSVTGVGGTTLTLNSSGNETSETVWDNSTGATGGGISRFFARPSWQTGLNVPAGTKRCVPDVSCAADPNAGAYVYLGGVAKQIGGTSWSAPTWAGFCALINQARAENGVGPIGLLNPKIYPLLGTSCFRDITSGNNGDFTAKAGYDLATGLGSPILSALLPALSGSGNGAPALTSFSPAAGPVGTNVTLNGFNLSRVSGVSFNGTAVSSSNFAINSDTSINAVVPEGATSGPITLTSGSLSAMSHTNFTVAPLPTNDNIANATILTGTSGSIQGSNVAASLEPGEPEHAGNMGGASVWYRWTAPDTASYTITTSGSGTNFDTLLDVYTGTTFGTLATVASNDDAGIGSASSVTFSATAGTVYSIALDGYDGATGSIQLSWEEDSTAPTITNFTPQSGTTGDSIVISGANLLGVQTVTFGQTTGTAAFTANSDNQITAVVPGGAATGPITVTGPAGSAVSDANFVFTAKVLNDNCLKGTTLPGASGSITGNNSGATKEPGEPDHAGEPGGKSIWYSWTPASNGPETFTTFGSSFDTLLAVYTGTSVSTLTPVASNDDYGNTVTSSVTFLAHAGTLYRIAVDGLNGTSGNVVLNWSKDDSLPLILGFSPAAGPVGTTIQITGSNFTGASAVSLGQTSLNFSVVSDTEIDAVVPAGASTAFLSVTNLLGTVNSPSRFTVTAAPLNDSFASDTTSPFALAGDLIHVNGSNVGATKQAGEPDHAGNAGGASVWWSWTPPATGVYAISTQGSSFDTLLGVYTGSAVNALSTVASNDDDPAGGQTSYVTITATMGTTYHIAVDGLNGASGPISLNIYAQQASTALYSTGFETKDGFVSGQLVTAGTAGWQSSVAGSGEEILSNQDGLTGQQASVGLHPPAAASPAAQGIYIWKPIDYKPTADEPIVKFTTTMAINDSTNGNYDDFQWQLFNKEGHAFFTIDFDNNDLSVYYRQDGTRASFVNSGLSFNNGEPMQLVVLMDFAHNLWSATLNGNTIAKNKAIRTGNAALDFGDMDAAWQIYDVSNIGDNAMVFDNYSLVAEQNPVPMITFQPQSQTVSMGDAVTFSVVAGGEAPILYQWALNGKAIANATSASLIIPDAEAANAGTYTVTVSNAVGLVKSAPARLVVNPRPAAPVFTVQPQSMTVAQNATAVFKALAAGYPPPQYQWVFEGSPVVRGTAATLSVKNVQAFNEGGYVLTASNSLGVATSGTAVLTVGATLSANRGNYNGIIQGPGDAAGVGELKVAVAANGAFTGTLALDGHAYHLAGTFNAQGAWQGTVGGKIVVHLQLALTGSAQITGTILNQSATGNVTAARDNYSKTGTLAPQAGTYTMTMTGTAAGLPQGIGYASVTVDTAGNVRAAGKMNDFTAFSVSGVLADDGSWPFYTALYAGGGYVRGELFFHASGQPVLDGTLSWHRPVSTGNNPYDQGIQGDLGVAGYLYTPPAKNTAAVPLNSAGQGVITFTGSVLSSGTISGTVALNATQTLTASGGPVPFTLKLSAATGVFTGTVDAFNRKIPYGGVLLQPLNEGTGLFQSPTWSGPVQITPAQ